MRVGRYFVMMRHWEGMEAAVTRRITIPRGGRTVQSKLTTAFLSWMHLGILEFC